MNTSFGISLDVIKPESLVKSEVLAGISMFTSPDFPLTLFTYGVLTGNALTSLAFKVTFPFLPLTDVTTFKLTDLSVIV